MKIERDWLVLFSILISLFLASNKFLHFKNESDIIKKNKDGKEEN